MRSQPEALLCESNCLQSSMKESFLSSLVFMLFENYYTFSKLAQTRDHNCNHHLAWLQQNQGDNHFRLD